MAADDGIKPRWAELGQMDRAALRVAWTEAFDHALPHFLSVIFMPKALIWQEQCKQFGDLTPDLKRASRAAATENQVRAQVPQIRTGTQLVRAWNGRRYRVDVTSDGFRMNGGHFRVAVCHRIADHRHHLVRAKVLRSERSGGSGFMKKIRCAIYTGKSSEDGLEQEFNSLDAQYEACAPGIASQKAEGRVSLPERHDDGGLSGGTMERPGVQRLLEDIDHGAVDQILVYKIARLIRSLADFAKMVERLDAAGT